ncbi:MAG TPA: hypothetical protein DIU00_10135 [Phycisphaerales bacterium]|nr:hypothetical protein [Phycisphaerales bacterium]
MRRLRRAYQRQNRKRNKLPCTRSGIGFRKRAIVAGTAVAITLGAGAGLNKALAKDKPDVVTHQQPVSGDADADMLSSPEEAAIGYLPFTADQNRNDILDGAELAERCVSVINKLPAIVPGSTMPIPNEPHKIEHALFGIERCDICGREVNMGGVEIVNPRVDLSYPDPNDPLNGIYLPELALHYMEHGSFDCYGDIHSGRVDIARLLRVLELRYPNDPNEHQLAVEGDLDGDMLTDAEELATGYNLYDADQDDDLTPDGIELARQCAEAVDALPVFDPNGPEVNAIYKVNYLQRGLENCDTCGLTVNMGYWEITNLRLGLSIDVPVLSLHYMEHGSFSFSGDVHGTGRTDLALLVKILEMPRQCGDLGTIYSPADLNRDCQVDSDDFVIFSEQWLQYTDSNQGQ